MGKAMSYTTEMQWTARYERSKSPITLNKSERENLLREYFAHYQTIAETDPSLLNQKIPREVFKGILDMIGGVLLEETKALASRPGPVQAFLERNTLPPSLSQLLPPEFRVFCLALNALKQ